MLRRPHCEPLVVFGGEDGVAGPRAVEQRGPLAGVEELKAATLIESIDDRQIKNYTLKNYICKIEYNYKI